MEAGGSVKGGAVKGAVQKGGTTTATTKRAKTDPSPPPSKEIVKTTSSTADSTVPTCSKDGDSDSGVANKSA